MALPQQATETPVALVPNTSTNGENLQSRLGLGSHLLFHRYTDSITMPDSPHPQRHPTLYFPTGDVVLSAGASIDSGPLDVPPTTQLFRVHKFLLMHHSITFSNMFADANPASCESYDGVPMVALQGDKAEDLALLLNYLYNAT